MVQEQNHQNQVREESILNMDVELEDDIFIQLKETQ
jgi:hypothetical protein